MKVAANGIHIHVKDQGCGSTAVLFLHYWGGSSRTWDPVITALGTRYRTIAPRVFSLDDDFSIAQA